MNVARRIDDLEAAYVDVLTRTVDPKAVGDRIRTLREEANSKLMHTLTPAQLRRKKSALTQVDLGARVEVSGNTIARWERGEMEAWDAESLQRVADFLSDVLGRPITIAYILYGTDERVEVERSVAPNVAAIAKTPKFKRLEPWLQERFLSYDFKGDDPPYEALEGWLNALLAEQSGKPPMKQPPRLRPGARSNRRRIA